jgi:hypothetical protein
MRKKRGSILAGLLLTTCVLVGTFVVGGQAAYAHESAAAPDTTVSKTFNDASGKPVTITGHALSANEIKALGIEKYVDMSNLTLTTPQFVSRGSMAPVTAVQQPTKGAVPLASGCWSYRFSRGKSGWLFVYTDVNWCGGGTWVTYANAQCNGYASWPTWNYESCSDYLNYGVGWNLYQVKTTWRVCLDYIPWPVGACGGITDFPWDQFQFLGNGAVYYNGGGQNF